MGKLFPKYIYDPKTYRLLKDNYGSLEIDEVNLLSAMEDELEEERETIRRNAEWSRQHPVPQWQYDQDRKEADERRAKEYEEQERKKAEARKEKEEERIRANDVTDKELNRLVDYEGYHMCKISNNVAFCESGCKHCRHWLDRCCWKGSSLHTHPLWREQTQGVVTRNGREIYHDLIEYKKAHGDWIEPRKEG